MELSGGYPFTAPLAYLSKVHNIIHRLSFVCWKKLTSSLNRLRFKFSVSPKFSVSEYSLHKPLYREIHFITESRPLLPCIIKINITNYRLHNHSETVTTKSNIYGAEPSPWTRCQRLVNVVINCFNPTDKWATPLLLTPSGAAMLRRHFRCRIITACHNVAYITDITDAVMRSCGNAMMSPLTVVYFDR